MDAVKRVLGVLALCLALTVASFAAPADVGQNGVLVSGWDARGSGVPVSTTEVVTARHLIGHEYESSPQFDCYTSKGLIMTDIKYVSTKDDLMLLEKVTTDNLSPEAAFILMFSKAASEFVPAVLGEDPVKGEDVYIVGSTSIMLNGARDASVVGYKAGYIVLDGVVAPGDSGGGLYNKKKELIGIIVAHTVVGEQHVYGLAVPVSKVKKFLEEAK